MFTHYLSDPEWQAALSPVMKTPALHQLENFLNQEMRTGSNILPAQDNWFTAFNSTPLAKVSVVILGQDPYPTPGHAHGLSFSVQPDVKPLPKSLVNIYKELASDLNIMNSTGCLLPWARQGVLLLNTVLTVKAHAAGSHQGKGWEQLTDQVIETLQQRSRPLVFVLWGKQAQKKRTMIDATRHLVLEAAHPSPLSAYRGFWGSRPFSRINQFLKAHGRDEIDWNLG